VIDDPYSRYKTINPSYGPVNPKAAENTYILQWWTGEHDRLLAHQIQTQGAHWWPSPYDIERMTPRTALCDWWDKDPQCLRKSWPILLEEFALARAAAIGLTTLIRWSPYAKTCHVCMENFEPRFARGATLGEFCDVCIDEAIFASGSYDTSPGEISNYLRALASAIERVPEQAFGTARKDLRGFDAQKTKMIIELLKKRPSVDRVKFLFGSWLAALIQAGILEDGTRKGIFGIQCLAKDGHVCLSLAEKTLDDILTAANVVHDREVWYGEGKYRADFQVNGILLEYFGLQGVYDYDLKTVEKISFCRKNGLVLIPIYPKDLANNERLQAKLRPVLKKT
jgi:hypothetical protein